MAIKFSTIFLLLLAITCGWQAQLVASFKEGTNDKLSNALGADPDVANLIKLPTPVDTMIPKSGEDKSGSMTSSEKIISEDASRESALARNPNLDGITKESLISMVPIDGEDQKSFALSFLMIIFSEVGDKTFLIAAIMAMNHPRMLVFFAAFSSLVVMSILSAALGHAVPALIPKRYTNYLAAVLFLVFGSRMLMEGLKMRGGTASVKEEMEEVKNEIKEQEEKVELETMETGGVRQDPLITSSFGLKRIIEGTKNLGTLLFSPVFVQTFVLTFLGEWGDRSQIATIALAAAQNVYWVTLGTVTGHALCTSVAVIGGRLLASRISVKTVTLGGSILFIVFALISFLEALYHQNVDDILN